MSCIRGYTAVLSNLLWMGPIPGLGGDADEAELEVPCAIERVNLNPEFSVTNWVQWNARLRCVKCLHYFYILCGSRFPSCTVLV